MKIKTKSPEETEVIGFLLGQKLISLKKKKNSLILALSGLLGSGKSVFVRGLSLGLGVKKTIFSPTFVIIKRYRLGNEFYKNLYHLDCYRLDNPEEMLSLGFKTIISNSQNIVAIEWAEKIKKILPPKTIWLKFKYGKEKNDRIIETNLKI